jgi:hypothetical protein
MEWFCTGPTVKRTRKFVMAQTAGARKIGEQRRCQPAPAPIDSELWQAWEQQLAAEHLARRILAALPLLDLQPLWESTTRLQALEAACEADLENQPLETKWLDGPDALGAAAAAQALSTCRRASATTARSQSAPTGVGPAGRKTRRH